MFSINSYTVKLVKEGRKRYACDKVCSPEDAYRVFDKYLYGTDRENFVVLLLNVKNGILGLNTVSVGTLTASPVSPREVFKPAILANAASIVVGHNHPSNDIIPSREDIATTNRLVEAGKILDIPVLDHVIVGIDRYYSFKEMGYIK